MFSFGKTIPWNTTFFNLHKPFIGQLIAIVFFTCIIINIHLVIIFPNYFFIMSVNYFEEISRARETNFKSFTIKYFMLYIILVKLFIYQFKKFFFVYLYLQLYKKWVGWTINIFLFRFYYHLPYNVTLNLSDNSYRPFLKTDQYPFYINVNYNHPNSIIKQVPKVINTRISSLSSNKIFHESSKMYIEALKNSGFKEEFTYLEPRISNNININNKLDMNKENTNYNNNNKNVLSQKYVGKSK